MNTPRAIIHQLGACYGVAKTFGDLVESTGKPRPEVAAYLDQLVLDGVITRRIWRPVALAGSAVQFEVWELNDYTSALCESGFYA